MYVFFRSWEMASVIIAFPTFYLNKRFRPIPIIDSLSLMPIREKDFLALKYTLKFTFVQFVLHQGVISHTFQKSRERNIFTKEITI